MSDALIVFVPLLLIGVVVVALLFRGQLVTPLLSFFVAARDVSGPIGALSMASAWIWAIALFVLPQKTYQIGILATIPFVVVNAACLLLAGVIALRIRSFCGDRQITGPQFGRERDGRLTEIVLTVSVLGRQVYSVILHLTAATLLLQFMPHGLPKFELIGMLSAGFFLVPLIWGLESSIPADILKFAGIGCIIVLAAYLVLQSGGIPALASGMDGLRAPASGLADWHTVWTFVIPTSMILLSSAVADEQILQRGFALRRRNFAPFAVAALLFLIVAIALTFFGLLAANKELGIHIASNDADLQLVVFHTIQQLVPQFPLILAVSVFMLSIIASGGAALHAAGNVGAKNVVQFFDPYVSDGWLVWISRATMLVTLAIGAGVALDGAKLFQLWLGVGIFRAVLFFPMLALVMTKRQTVPTVFPWIIFGAICAAAAFFLCLRGGDAIVAAMSSAIMVAWGSTFAAWLVQMLFARSRRMQLA